MADHLMSHFIKVLEQAGLCVVLVVAPTVAVAQSNPKLATASPFTAGDRKFLSDAADGGMAEVELGKLATQRASDENVKRFGQRMVDEHNKTNEELRRLAASKGIDLPRAPSTKTRDLQRRLASLNGVSFDKAYMIETVVEQKEYVAAFQKESNWGGDDQLKSLATKTLPTLRDHLKNAQDISTKGTSALGGMLQNASGKPSPSKLASTKPNAGKRGSLLN